MMFIIFFALFVLAATLGILITVMMTRREELKKYEIESTEATNEMLIEKAVGFAAGITTVSVGFMAFFAIDIGWFSVVEFAAVLIAGYVVYIRMRHQRAVLATCRDVRERKSKTAR